MSSEHLYALATAHIPYLDRVVALSAAGFARVVVRRRREPGRVVGEGHRKDCPAAMALQCLQTRTLFVSCSWLYRDPFRVLFLEKTPYDAADWTEQKCRCIGLKRTDLYCPFLIHDEPARILN
jgi:hypothetical protein